MDQIPIRINRKDSNPSDIMFKILPIQKRLHFSKGRQKAFHSIEKQSYQIKNQRKHDTLDPKGMRSQNRYRRISSSGGGTHKFPKDFFHLNDLPKSPIKIRFSRNKKQNLNLLESLKTQNQNNFESSQEKHSYQQKKKYKLQSPERNCQLQKTPSQVQTPKFNLKFFADQDLQEAKSKTTQRKIKMDEYLSHKKQQFPNFFKRVDKKKSQDQNQQLKQKKCYEKANQKTALFEITSGQNNPNQLLLETLGKHDNEILKNPSIQTHKRRRIQSSMEKENRTKQFQPVKTNKKSIKAFLSTKGLNWKILQKINQMNCQSTGQNQTMPMNFRQQINVTSLKKGLTQKIDLNQNILGNTFRVRKCV